MQQKDAVFIQTVKNFYNSNHRDLPWRALSFNTQQRFYEVLVSELMLQQTQVSRVIPKYKEWMKTLPTLQVAVQAELADVLVLWQGLGYNRRGKYLHDALKSIARKGIPKTVGDLTQLPGVGSNTAGAIMAYAFNKPTAYIETNIRTVYIHHYFNDQACVTDGQILNVVNRTLDLESPREWYWALMDYGSHLKRSTSNISQSAHYKKQTQFEGSSRQLRALILKLLLTDQLTKKQLEAIVADLRLSAVLDSLVKDGLIQKYSNHYGITR